MGDVTLILQAIGRNEPLASEQLLPLVYDELRRLAAARMAREQPGQTLQGTALVHEAWLELVGAGDRSWENRAHGQVRLNIDDLEVAATTPEDNILLLNEALERLEKEDPEQARIVVLKYFGGLTNEEVAKNLNLSSRTVDRQWACAKACLFQWMRESR